MKKIIIYLLFFIASSFSYSQVQGRWKISDIEYNWEALNKDYPELQVDTEIGQLVTGKAFNSGIEFTDIRFLPEGVLFIDTPFEDHIGEWYHYEGTDKIYVRFRINGNQVVLNLILKENRLYFKSGFGYGFYKYSNYISNKPFLWRPSNI